MNDIATFLKWFRLEGQSNPVLFDVVFPTFVNNDETEYNLITGPESDNLPPFA